MFNVLNKETIVLLSGILIIIGTLLYINHLKDTIEDRDNAIVNLNLQINNYVLEIELVNSSVTDLENAIVKQNETITNLQKTKINIDEELDKIKDKHTVEIKTIIEGAKNNSNSLETYDEVINKIKELKYEDL